MQNIACSSFKYTTTGVTLTELKRHCINHFMKNNTLCVLSFQFSTTRQGFLRSENAYLITIFRISWFLVYLPHDNLMMPIVYLFIRVSSLYEKTRMGWKE